MKQTTMIVKYKNKLQSIFGHVPDLIIAPIPDTQIIRGTYLFPILHHTEMRLGLFVILYCKRDTHFNCNK